MSRLYEFAACLANVSYRNLAMIAMGPLWADTGLSMSMPLCRFRTAKRALKLGALPARYVA
jgi:hypothetical protein